MAGNDEMRVQV